MPDEQATRPRQMAHAELMTLFNRGDADAVEKAVRSGVLDDVRARMRAARPDLVAGLAAQPVDATPGWLDRWLG